MSDHKCKVAFKCGQHAVYEEITENCPYCRLAELEQSQEYYYNIGRIDGVTSRTAPAPTDEQQLVINRARKLILAMDRFRHVSGIIEAMFDEYWEADRALNSTEGK